MSGLVYLKTKKQKKAYIRFVSAIYTENIYSRDALSRLLEGFLFEKTCFCKTAEVIPVAVLDKAGRILCAATFIIAGNMRDILQISFLEMVPDGYEAFALILKEARKKALQTKARKIVAGLNGHVNYGMGFLVDHFQTPQSFGSPYNPPGYIEVLEKNGGVPAYQVSFVIDMPQFHDKWLGILEKKINPALTYRTGHFHSIEKEVQIYTDLNNIIFKDHPLYFKRHYEEDLELFKEFSVLLRGEHFLVAEDQGNPVGFLLWYPDFNQLLKEGESLGVKTVLKNKLFGKKIDRFKIVEIGILPEYQGRNVSWGLLKKCSDLTRGRYQTCESGWIFDDNSRSRGLAETWEGSSGESIRRYKKYGVYYFDV